MARVGVLEDDSVRKQGVGRQLESRKLVLRCDVLRLRVTGDATKDVSGGEGGQIGDERWPDASTTEDIYNQG